MVCIDLCVEVYVGSLLATYWFGRDNVSHGTIFHEVVIIVYRRKKEKEEKRTNFEPNHNCT